MRRKVFVVDPDQAVFARLFRRLLFWYASILAVLVILLIISIGTTVPWQVFALTEHDLSGHVSQLAQVWQDAPAKACPLTQPDQGLLFACYDAQGRLIAARNVAGEPARHFLDNALALSALHQDGIAQDALDQTGTQQASFDFVFLASGEVRIVRQAQVVHKAGSQQVLGIVQVGTTPDTTMAYRATLVDVFLACLLLGLVLGVPAGSWYLAGKALQPARLAFQRQRDFIANVSHELGTPLALLRANADVLLRSHSSQLAPEDAELLQDIMAETIYMDKMTSNMLLLARMDSDQLPLKQESCDLGQLAEDVVRRAQTRATQLGLTLTWQQEEPASTVGDQTLLEQVTLILLDNALKYTPAGGKVSLYTFTEQGQACLRINDTGIGIVQTDLSRLGERFYRVDKARSRAVGGAGLGLSIARGIVDRHHGELTLTSEPGKGTSATMRLPEAQ